MTSDALKQMQIMRMQGKTYAEIGARYGVSRQRVHQLVGDTVVIVSDDVQEKKCHKTIESLLSLKKYQSSPIKVVVDDTIALIISLKYKVESLEKEIETLKRSDTE